MPSKTERQRKMMGAVMECEKGGKCSPMTKEMSKHMKKDDIKDFLKKKPKK